MTTPSCWRRHSLFFSLQTCCPRRNWRPRRVRPWRRGRGSRGRNERWKGCASRQGRATGPRKARRSARRTGASGRIPCRLTATRGASDPSARFRRPSRPDRDVGLVGAQGRCILRCLQPQAGGASGPGASPHHRCDVQHVRLGVVADLTRCPPSRSVIRASTSPEPQRQKSVSGLLASSGRLVALARGESRDK